jgi:hypothetical protein
LTVAHVKALAVQTEAEHAPFDKKNPTLHVKATVSDKQVAALVPQATQAPFET